MKKLLSVFLCVCMTLAACGAVFAAEKKEEAKSDEAFDKLKGKLSEYVDDETLSAILSTLNRLAELSADDPTEDYKGEYDFIEYLYRLGYGDVLESGKYNESVTDYLEELLADSEKYAKDKLSEKDFIDLINRGSGKTDDILELDKDELLKSDEDELFTLDDIKYIFKELGVEEELTDEEYENTLFALLFVMRMIEIYYWESMDEISPLEVLYTLYVLSKLYGTGELDDVDIEEIIELLGLEEAIEIIEAAEIASMVYTAAEAVAAGDEAAYDEDVPEDEDEPEHEDEPGGHDDPDTPEQTPTPTPTPEPTDTPKERGRDISYDILLPEAFGLEFIGDLTVHAFAGSDVSVTLYNSNEEYTVHVVMLLDRVAKESHDILPHDKATFNFTVPQGTDLLHVGWQIEYLLGASIEDVG